MNNAIADCYLEQMKTRDLSERELKEAIYASIRSDNAKLLEACMGKLPTEEEYWGEDRYPTYFAIREMASSEIIRILVENGYKLPYHPDILPWNGSPEDSINLIILFRVFSLLLSRGHENKLLWFQSSFQYGD